MRPDHTQTDDFDLKFPESELSEDERRKIEAARDSVSQLIVLYPEHADILGQIKIRAEDREQAKKAAHDYLDLTRMDRGKFMMLGNRIKTAQFFKGITGRLSA